MKKWTTIALALIVFFGFSGCSRAKYSYRYKLTLSVETPDGIKTGYSVVEQNHYEVGFPHKGVYTAITGEGLYLDLGKGRKPIVTLLTRREGSSILPYGVRELQSIYKAGTDWDQSLVVLQKSRGSRPIELNQLPELVSFADPHDSKTVMPVNAWNLEEYLGQGVKWRQMTIEITDEPITTGLEQKLPWVNSMNSAMLDGAPASQGYPFANTLNTADLIRRGY